MFIWSVNSAARIMSNSRMSRTDTRELILHSARNMTVSGQLVMRDWENFEITDVKISTSDSITSSWCFADDVVFNDGVPYPDIMSTSKIAKVKAHTAQIIWITLEVDRLAPVQTNKIEITVQTDKGEHSVEWLLTVHKAILPEPCNSDFGHEYFFDGTRYFSTDTEEREKPCNPFYLYQRYSDKWWQLMDNTAAVMKKMRVNIINITVMPLLRDSGTKRTSQTEWTIKFDRLIESIEHFLANGSFKYIAISHIIQPVDGKTIASFDENGNIIKLDIYTDEAEAWAKAFYGGLYKCFEEKGWLSILLMRLQDEPHTSEYWKWARQKCREYMPNILCGDALDTHSVGRELENDCDIFIPRLEVYDEGDDFYRGRQAAGKTVWCYSCCYPEENWWLNKFIDLPHSYSRMIEWGCFAQGISGFLHWGFSYWAGEMYGMSEAARFKGDGYIVYPDVLHNTYKLSARAVATRDGVADWELLHMLERKSPESAKAISKRVCRKFDDFCDDLSGKTIDQARNEVLALLDAE